MTRCDSHIVLVRGTGGLRIWLVMATVWEVILIALVHGGDGIEDHHFEALSRGSFALELLLVVLSINCPHCCWFFSVCGSHRNCSLKNFACRNWPSFGLHKLKPARICLRSWAKWTTEWIRNRRIRSSVIGIPYRSAEVGKEEEAQQTTTRNLNIAGVKWPRWLIQRGETCNDLTGITVSCWKDRMRRAMKVKQVLDFIFGGLYCKYFECLRWIYYFYWWMIEYRDWEERLYCDKLSDQTNIIIAQCSAWLLY